MPDSSSPANSDADLSASNAPGRRNIDTNNPASAKGQADIGIDNHASLPG